VFSGCFLSVVFSALFLLIFVGFWFAYVFAEKTPILAFFCSTCVKSVFNQCLYGLVGWIIHPV
jgi:hypothetical protein